MDITSKLFSAAQGIPSRLEIDVTDYSTVNVLFVGGSVAATGFAASFEASLDSGSKESGKWTTILGPRSNSASAIDSAVTGLGLGIGVANTYSHTFNVVGIKRFRIRATAITAGEVVAIVTTSKDTTAFLPATSISISGTAAVSNGLLATAATGLGKAEDAVAASGDVGVAMLGVRAPATPVAQVSAAGEYSFMMVDIEGKLINSGQGAAELSWQSRSVVASTTDVALRAAGAAGIRNYLTDIIIENTSGTGVEVNLKDGTTVIASFYLPATSTITHSFKTPIRSTAATAFNVALYSGTNACVVTATGYTGI